MKEDMVLSALISSRICHDLISPVGAISNGLELLAMSGSPPSEEMSLISDSAKTAAASLRFMRIAFGAGSPTEMFAAHQLGDIANDYFATSRLRLIWPAARVDVNRDDAKLAFLTLLAASAAMPVGGVVRLTGLGDDPVRLSAELEGSRVTLDETARGLLSGALPVADADPRQAPLALLSLITAGRGLSVEATMSEGAGELRIS